MLYCLLQGASFGYHAGGWGKPPVDEQGKPLYGDVFGIQQQEAPVVEEDEQIENQPWGELESESEEESESEVSHGWGGKETWGKGSMNHLWSSCLDTWVGRERMYELHPLKAVMRGRGIGTTFQL